MQVAADIRWTVGTSSVRSDSTVSPVVPSTRRATLGDRVSPATAARPWNDLPPTIRASPSLLTFRQHLETVLFNFISD